MLAARGDQLLGEFDAFNRGYQLSVGKLARLPIVVGFSEGRRDNVERLKSEIQSLLTVLPGSDANLRGVALLDLSGTVKIATEEQLVGKNLSYHGYVREALRGASVISDIHLAESEVGYTPTIAYLAPVRGPDTKIIGLAVQWIRAKSLWDIARASNELAGPRSFAVVFDRQGIRIAHTYSEDIVFHPGGALDIATIDALVAERRFGEKTRVLLEDIRAFPEQFDRARSESTNGELFRGFAPVNQTWNYGVARRLETVPWTIFYMIPEEFVNVQITQTTRNKTVFAGAIILIALIAGTLFAAVILRPVRSLSTATAALAGGDLAARVQVGRADELGRLGANFNSMAERIEAQAEALKTVNEQLELRVERRTTELRQTTKALELEIVERKHADERNRAIVSSALDGIISMNHEGRFVEFNPAAERIFGHRSSDVIGRALAEVIIPPALRDAHRRGLAHYLATGVGPVLGKRLELTGLRADGSTIPVELSITRMPGAGPPMFTAFLRDITERKRAEEALRESEQNLATTLNSIGDAVIATDMEGRVVRMNPVAEQLTGWPLQEAQERPLDEVFRILNEDTRGPAESPVARVLREGVVVGLANHTVLCSRDGTERPIADSGAPIRDPEGEIRGVVLVFRDRTEERRTEEMRIRSIQLEAQNLRVQEANRLKSEFLANMSHELRTPLNAIIGFTGTLLMKLPGPLNADQEKQLRTVQTGAQHLLALINDLLDLAKIESGKVELKLVPTDCKEVIEEVAESLRPQAAAKGLEFTVTVPQGLSVRADRRAMSQIVINLTNNAIKFTGRGSVRIRAGRYEEDGGKRLEISVEDTGIGIRPEDQKKLFGAFTRVDDSSNRRYEGTGLGLHLSRNLAQALGGRIVLKSEYGRGSTFTLVLPER